MLISCVFFASFLLAGVAVYYGYPNGLNIFAFMMEEVSKFHLISQM